MLIFMNTDNAHLPQNTLWHNQGYPHKYNKSDYNSNTPKDLRNSLEGKIHFDQSNYYKWSSAIFLSCVPPYREPNFISESGTNYWFDNFWGD